LLYGANMSKKKNVWAWRDKHSDVPHGLFASRDAAVADARKYYKDVSVDIMVGTAVWPNPSENFPSLDSFLEQLDDSALSNRFSWYGDLIYECKGNYEQAEKALHEVLTEWSSKWIKSADIWTIDNEEMVTLP
jgi:hypothetical protein